MIEKIKEVYNEALTLPPIERIELIEYLYFSLDSPESREHIDALWVDEAEERISAFENNELKAISAKEVFKKIDMQRKSED